MEFNGYFHLFIVLSHLSFILFSFSFFPGLFFPSLFQFPFFSPLLLSHFFSQIQIILSTTQWNTNFVYLCFRYNFNISEDKPFSRCLRVSDIMPKNLETVFATSVLTGHNTVNSLSLSFKSEKPGIRADILPKKQFLFSRKVWHFRTKCSSVSNSELSQNKQILFFRGVTGEV